jgi:uncharacterized Zn finger protein
MAMRYEDFYPPYVPVAQRRAKAEKKLRQLRKKRPNIKPVIIAGRSLATTWWGQSWNSNLERYADYHNRIERGRSYVRHRAVLDLQMRRGDITALVQGSETKPYDVSVKIDELNARNWATIRQACEGSFDSLAELLAGKFPQSLKDLFFQQGSGLFPAPKEIHFDCSCPDWASMCKHVAAVLYGIGARLDEEASLFFTLRGINVDDIITQTVADTTQALLNKAEQQRDHVLDDADIGDVFGIQLDDIDVPAPALPPVGPTALTATQPARKSTPRAKKKRVPAGKPSTARRQNKLATADAISLPAVRRKTRRQAPVVTPPTAQNGAMQAALLKAVGKARKGKSVDQLQSKLGWTKTQVRNAITRARAKGLVEAVQPGLYRQTT